MEETLEWEPLKCSCQTPHIFKAECGPTVFLIIGPHETQDEDDEDNGWAVMSFPLATFTAERNEDGVLAVGGPGGTFYPDKLSSEAEAKEICEVSATALRAYHKRLMH